MNLKANNIIYSFALSFCQKSECQSPLLSDQKGFEPLCSTKEATPHLGTQWAFDVGGEGDSNQKDSWVFFGEGCDAQTYGSLPDNI